MNSIKHSQQCLYKVLSVTVSRRLCESHKDENIFQTIIKAAPLRPTFYPPRGRSQARSQASWIIIFERHPRRGFMGIGRVPLMPGGVCRCWLDSHQLEVARIHLQSGKIKHERCDLWAARYQRKSFNGDFKEWHSLRLGQQAGLAGAFDTFIEAYNFIGSLRSINSTLHFFTAKFSGEIDKLVHCFSSFISILGIS